MRDFAALLDGLVFAPQRLTKLALIERWLRATPDPDRGWGLAALTGALSFSNVKPALIRSLVEARVDPVLFALSYDFVGDLAETAALVWPAPAAALPPPSLSQVVARLSTCSRAQAGDELARLLDALDASGRFALLKLVTGALRVGVSARLAKTALAALGPAPVAEVEEVWHGQKPPYLALFAWLDGHAEPPSVALASAFRPLMLAHPVDEAELTRLDPAAFAAEWKWDGIRVQVAARGGTGRDSCSSADGSHGSGGGGAIFSRTGDDITASFPELRAVLDFAAVVDGELLVARDGEVAPFNDLQQRLGRKLPAAALQKRFPAHVRLYDILFEGEEDLRPLPFALRRLRLEAWYARTRPRRMDLSPMVPFADWQALAAIRAGARAAGIEGLMLKRRDSPYLAGRPKGLWFKWKRDPHTADCVLMYAQRGHGKRSSFYSDYTFGCWRLTADGTEELVPVGKAYSGFTDAELIELDRWVRNNTVERYGPVRAVAPGLVLEIAFDAVQVSSRHKSGVAMRFPRVHRIRWDKPPADADRLETLRSLAVVSG